MMSRLMLSGAAGASSVTSASASGVGAGPSTAAQKMQQLIKGERHLFASSDDTAVVKQVLATHAPDGRDIDVRPLLMLAEDILQRATPSLVLVPQTQLDAVEDKLHHANVIAMLEALAYTIHRISSEITYKCTGGGGDAHGMAVHLFNYLSNYSWDAKVVLVIAAFGMSYGEFWLAAQLHTVHPLARSVALLKQLPDILEHSDMLKPRFDAISGLIQAMLDVAYSIIEFKELPPEYISPDVPEMSMAMAHIPTAAYWTVRSAVACASQIIGLIGLGHEYISSTTEAWEISSLTHKVANIHGHLRKQLGLCNHHIDEKKHMEAYQTLTRLFETVHIDNMKILKAMISFPKDDLPLFDGSAKKRVGVDVLRRKIVILLVSDLDITPEELFVFAQLYNETSTAGAGHFVDPTSAMLLARQLERSYEIVWFPVVDRQPWSVAKEEAFRRQAAAMPWYSLHHPPETDRAVVKYVRESWHFDKKPLLVVLDPQGKVVCPNALHMMWIWGSLAYPFTSAREESLWREETWRLEFLVDEIDPAILSWIREGHHVCLYGGEDIGWIRRFTSVMRKVSLEAGVPLEMVYVGKSNPRERVKKAVAAIAAEKLSGYWPDTVMMWFFWVRLESMLHSKMRHGRSIEDDHIMQEVMTMLSFDGGDEGWALVGRGGSESSTVMAKAHGRKMVECLSDFEAWKGSVETEGGFVPALAAALLPYHTPEHCTRLVLPGDTGKITEQVVCAECRRPMEKYVLYRCCND